MGLPVSQRKSLDRIETGLRESDPRLAALFMIFSRLNHDEEMPRLEQLKAGLAWLRLWLRTRPALARRWLRASWRRTRSSAKPRLRTTIPVDRDTTSDIALSPDGRTLAVSASDQTIRLWDLADLAHPTIRAVLTGAGRPIAFPPDGHTLAVIGANGLLQLRETDLDQAAARICARTTAAMARAAWDRYLPGVPYQSPCP